MKVKSYDYHDYSNLVILVTVLHNIFSIFIEINRKGLESIALRIICTHIHHPLVKELCHCYLTRFFFNIKDRLRGWLRDKEQFY